MNKLAIGFCVVLASLSSAVMASTFEDFDLDKDGFISKSEAQVSDVLSAEFDIFDQDADGLISKEEFAEIQE
jgi:Ca2+-binding EF-hand superfamily protein